MNENKKEDIKRLAIKDVVSRLGGLGLDGKLQGNCPTGHDSKGGQCFSINTKGNYYHCFNCGIGGDVIDLVELVENKTFPEAIDWFRDNFNINNGKGHKVVEANPETKAKLQELYGKDILYELVFQHGKELLYSDIGKVALDYLVEARGYKLENLKQTDWIYYPKDSEIREYLMSQEPEAKKQIAILGLQGASGDRFRLAFPYRNRDGLITGFVKRATEAKGYSWSDSDSKSHNNVRWDSTVGLTKDDLFNLYNCRDSEHILIVEGYPDALYLPTLDFKNIVAIGQGALGAKHIDGIKTLGIEKVTICLDNDKAGIENTPKAVEKFKDSGIQVYTMNPTLMGDHKDPDEYVKANGIEAFMALCEGAELNIDTSSNPEAENKNNDPSKYFSDKKFIPSRLANELMSQYSFLYSTGELYLYQDGVYRPIGEAFTKRECRERLKEGARINSVNEVIAHIKDYSDVKAEKVNTHKHLINLINGMYDYKEGKLLEHSTDYLSTIRIPVSYDPGADSNVISDWLASILPDGDSRRLVYELFGYCMIPDTTMKKAFMLVGESNTGKSTFLTVLENFIGNDNVSKIPLQEISDSRFKRAELFGKLVNLFADLDNKALKSTSYFKTIVSGDTIDAERKCQNPFFFRPFSRLIFSANEIPIASDKSTAYFNRWNILNFDQVFAGTNDKKGFADELSKPENLSALLNGALCSLQTMMSRQSFTVTEKGKQAILEYQKQNDPTGAFVETCCELNKDSRIIRGDLFIEYERYCEENEFNADEIKDFYKRIRILKGVKEIDGKNENKKGVRFFTGIKLIAS